jgi:hypothetical protein
VTDSVHLYRVNGRRKVEALSEAGKARSRNDEAARGAGGTRCLTVNRGACLLKRSLEDSAIHIWRLLLPVASHKSHLWRPFTACSIAKYVEIHSAICSAIVVASLAAKCFNL